ncbi:MAG: hypothetical protein Kow0031_05400 [Anaerolineae bacterium]
MKNFSSLSITTQFTALFIGAVALSLTLIGGILTYVSFQAQSKQLNTAQQAQAHVVSEKINAYFDDLQRKLTYLARVRGLTAFDAPVQHSILEGLIYHNSAYQVVGITDDTGHLLQSFSRVEAGVPQEWGDTAAFRRAFQEQEDYFGPVELSSGNFWPTLILAVPVRDAENKVDGMLFARVNLKFLWAILDEAPMGDSGYVYVVNGGQLVVAQSGGDYTQSLQTDISKRPPGNLSSAPANAQQAYRGLYDEMVLGNAAIISGANWRVVVELPVKEAYAPLYNLLRVMAIGLILGIIVFGALGVFLAQQITRPLERLTHAATQLSDGVLETRVVIDQQNELKILGDAFNQMAAQLGETINQLHQDIIERKQAESALVLANEQLTLAQRSAGAGIWDWNIPAGQLNWAPELFELFGLDPTQTEATFDVWRNVMHPEDRQIAEDRINESIRNRAPLFNEYRILLPSGQVRWINALGNTLFNEQGEAQRMSGICLDITERKQAEELLRERERKLEVLFEILPVGISILDKERKITFLNPALEHILDITREGLLSGVYKNRTYLRPDGSPMPAEEFASSRVTREGRPVYNVETGVVKEDGQVIWTNVSAVPVAFPDWQLVIVTTDITERKQAEVELRESEEKFSAMFRASPIPISIYKLDGQIIEANPAYLNLTGYSYEETVGSSSINQNLLSPETRQQVIAAMEQNGGSLRNLEVEIRLRDGSTRTILLSGENISIQGVPHRLGINVDITERKQAEEALRLQSAALNAAANAILITDRTGLIQWVNPAFCDMTGYTAAEAVGKNLSELVKSGQQDHAFYTNLWETIMTGQVWRGEIINRRQDGSIYTEEETITPVRDAHNEISHFIAIKQDISSRKALEIENKSLTEQFYQAQKMDSIGQLAGGIAHDFNNLLMPIVGYAEIGMMTTPPGGKLYTHFEHIKAAGERAAALTRQILAFSRRQVLEMTMVDLNQVIAEFEKMLQRVIGEDVSLKTHLADDLPPIKADKGQLEQILLNLAINARDAMPAGGRLSIETDQVTLDESYVIRHTEVRPGLYVCLSISDTGHGMDATTQQRIFEPFFTTKPRGHGTGLGLSTVFGIVKQHGGNIWVYSEPEQGTSIKIYLPVIKTLTPIAPAEAPLEKPLGGTETILVIEDEAAVRELVSSTLRTYGYQVMEMGDPSQALVMAEAYQDTIHLLLTDVIMPDVNGREVFERLAADRCELKVLYMSGYTDETIAHHGVLDEGIAFLQKPFSIHSLLQKVRLVLG